MRYENERNLYKGLAYYFKRHQISTIMTVIDETEHHQPQRLIVDRNEIEKNHTA